jgi:PAS domain S-box-containing protein
MKRAPRADQGRREATGRARATALQEREALLSSINDNLTGTCVYRMLYGADGGMTCLYVSPNVEHLIGVPAGEFQADPACIFGLVHEADRAGFRAAYAAALRTGDAGDAVVRVHSINGEERWMQFRSRLVERRADGGQVCDGVVVDITALKEVEIISQRQGIFSSTLHQITVELFGRRDQAELLQSIVSHSAALFNAAQVELDLIEGDVLVARGFQGERITRLGERVTRSQAPLSWQAIDRRQPVVMDNYSTHENARAPYRQLGITAVAILPIMHGSECLGTLGIARKPPGRGFSREEVIQGLVFCQLAALVLHQAGIYEEARREAELRAGELRASEQRLDRVVENINDALVVDDNSGRLVFANRRFFEMFGLPEQDPHGLVIEDYIAPEWRERLREQHDRRIRGEAAPETFEFENLRPDGRRCWLEVSATKVVVDGRITGTQSVIRDITDRKRTEQALREGEARNRVLVESSGDAIFVIDSASRIRSANPAAARMHGLTPGELVGMDIGELVAPSASGELPERKARLLRGETLTFETEHRRKDGTVFPLEVIATPFELNGEIFVLATERDITARKRDEQAVTQSLALLRATLESTADGILNIGTDGRILSFNQQFIAMWGIPAEVVASRDDDLALRFVLGQLVAPVGFLDKVRHLYAHPREESFDTLDFKDGRVFERYSRPMLVGGNPVGRVWSFRDITDRRRSERALTRAHERATVLAQLGRTLAEADTRRAVALAIIEGARQLLDWDGCWMHFWNEEKQAFEEPVNFDLVDGERREIASEHPYPLPPSPLMSRVMREGAQLLLRENADENAEGLLPFGTGRRSLSLMFAPIRRGEHLLGIVSIQSYRLQAYDQAALELFQTLADHCAGALVRLHSAAALRESEELFRGVFEASPIPILLFTAPEGRLTDVNPAALEAFGYLRSEVVGRTTDELGVWTRPEQRAGFFRRITVEKTVSGFEAVMRTKSGAERTMLCTGTLLQLAGQPRVLTSAVDITAVRQAEAEQATMRERAMVAQKQEALGTLAGGVAHDFNNILTGVLNYTQLAQSDCPPTHPQIKEFLGEVLKCGHRAKELVRQILLFSRAEAAERMPLMLQRTVQEALTLLRATIPATVALKTDLGQPGSVVLANATQIHQVMMNLGLNAAHAMQEKGGTLTVKLRRQQVDGAIAAELPELKPRMHLCLEVTDTGKGIAPADLTRIFEPFFTTKRVGEGTGLGLAVVHSIMHTHEGAIRVRSEPRHGTTFELFFPLLTVAAEAAVAPPRAAPRGGGQHILLIDDEPAIDQSMQILLKRLGYRVTVCADPRQALIRWEAAPEAFDAVITDFQMPGMTGIVLAKKMRVRRPGLPILIMSGFAGTNSLQNLRDEGFIDFLPKPFDLDKLAEMLAKILAESEKAGHGQA